MDIRWKVLECAETFRVARESTKDNRMVIMAERNGYTLRGKICLFRLFAYATLTKAIYRRFNIEWQPIMKNLESNPDMRLPVSASVKQDLLNSTSELATSHRRENISSFLFQD